MPIYRIMQQVWRPALILLVLCSLILAVGPSARGQGNPANAPRVVSTVPARRELVGPDSTLKIIFDQAMDRSSVEAALMIIPKVEGKLTWTDDTTLTFTPAALLQRGKEYTLNIAASAKSTRGVPLDDPFRLIFQITPNLSVSQVIPTPDSPNIEAGSTITVVFDRPVVPLVNSADQAKLPQPLTLSPAVEGKGEWVGTAIYVFRPKKALAGGTSYTATISTDLKDVDGSPMGKAYTWKFNTVAPRWEQINPSTGAQQVLLDTPITITFNQPMDQASLSAAFKVRKVSNGADVAGKLTFSNDGATLTFQPSSHLDLGTMYMINLLGSARSASGQATLSNPISTLFTTVPYPRVAQTYPKNGDKVPPSGNVSIEFNTQMDSTSFAGKVHVDPKPEKLEVNGSGNYLSLSFKMLPATSYTVTLDAGALDIYGNAIKDPTTFTFTTLNLFPSLGLADRNDVSVTSAYRPDTTIYAAAINLSEIDVRLSSLELPEALNLPWNNGYLNLSSYSPPRVSRAWKLPIDAQKNKNVRVELPLKLAGDNGGALTPGVYYFEINAPELINTSNKQPFPPHKGILIVATANLTVKTTPDELLIWVTDLKSGQALPSVQLTVYRDGKTILGSATTDASGLAHIKVSSPYQGYPLPYLITATGNGAFAVASNQWTTDLEPYTFKVNPENPLDTRIYLYSDQPVYRPGHPVYFRGIIRRQNDVNFTVPANIPVQVTLNSPQGQKIFDKKIMLNPYGAFNDKYDLPQDAPLGTYTLQVQYLGKTSGYENINSALQLNVAEFRPPEFLVTTTSDVTEIAAGETIHVKVNANFLFGGAVSAGKLTWTAFANQGYFNYTGDGNYEFPSSYYAYEQDGGYVYNRPVAQGDGTLDDKGQFEITLPADLGNVPVTQVFTIEATVTDVSNQTISGRTNVTVHPATLYIGLQPSAYVGTAKKPLDVKIITVDWASKPLAGQIVKVAVVSRNWEQDPNTLQWTYKATPVTDGQITTDASGKAVFTFTPPQAGIYEVEATARDARERIARTVTTIWVQGPNAVSWSRDNKHLTLIADKKSYNPGDIANVLITSPFPEPVQALVTVERAGIMKADVIIINSSYTYQLPLEVVHAPNVYVAVTLIRGSGKDNVLPELRYGLLNLPVSVKQQLKIKITPSTDHAQPGDTVKFDVLITDLDGNPVAAEVGLSMSDLANLSVGRANSAPIFNFFWSNRGLAVYTSAAMSKLIDGLTAKDIYLQQTTEETAQLAAPSASLAPTATGALKSAGGGANELNNKDRGAADGVFATDEKQQQPTPRTNFVDTPLWLPDLVSGTDGHATANVTLPDNLTTWRLDARGASAQTYVGSTSLDIVSTKPLLVRPATPRFFVVGDESELAMVINNNTDQDLSVQAKLDAKGVTLKGDPMQTVNIPKNGRVRVSWIAAIQDVDNVDLTFTAISGQYSDASKPAVGLGDQRLLPVYKYTSPDYVSTAGTLTQPGNRTEAVILPPATIAPTGELTVKLNSSLAATTLDGLNYLRNYPYQCVEQTVSKFLPNIITYRALQKLHLDKPQLRDNLDAAAKYAIARLTREQHSDGGWGWFPLDESNPLTTTYALLGLVEARAADMNVDKQVIDRAVGFLQTKLSFVTDATPAYEMNRLAFTLYVLARAGSPNTSLLDDLYKRREKMHLFARAFLAQAYHAANGDQAKLNTLLSDFQNGAVVSATGTHWEEKYRDYWNWDSDTRSTAIILETLTELTPKSELIPNVVRWLMVARRGDAWETTQETAWAVMALTSWMDVSGELNANYAYSVTVNGNALGSGQATADTLRDTKTLQIAVGDMLRDQANRVTIDHADGAGSLYYTATLHVNQPVEAIKPTNRGLQLSRTYYLNNKQVTSATVGDTLTVVLEITTNQDMYYLNIDDPIPAGTELLDKSLETTTQIGNPPELQSIDIERGWGWWWFSNTELRSDKIVLSATYLPRGSYRFVYQVQATTPGTYRVIPANGQEFYFPEVFGRGAGSLFTVMSGQS